MYKDAINYFKHEDTIIFELSKRVEPFELSVHPNPFIRLTRSIVGQQLSVKAAQTIFGRIEELFASKLITPEKLVTMSDEKLRSAGLFFQKISYLKDLAQRVI